ncbi:Site-specific DNA recombinase [Pelosinus propionicus DSM 13327]|uniref:Site-specific DNA recombinase n=2 Tax=Pelosinus TaxID=365348 RepID=A0A1I4GSP8_9FIRM|nr:Site-specific DNA recombinase [Pelosinus propionicus DSM 13327]
MNAIYARVSTLEQVEGYSLTDQVSSCRSRLTEMNALHIEEYIDDGYSGEYLERPALDRLREDIRNKRIESIVIYDPDRLSRNLTNQLLLADEMEKADTRLIFITHDYDASPEGRLFFSIRGAISAFEKAKIRERTMRGKRTKALSGKLVFNDKAFGYDYDKDNSMYIINDKEAAIIKLMYNLCGKKQYSLRDILLEFKSMGIVNRKNKPFTLSNIHRILINEMYSGTKWSFKHYGKKMSQYKTKIIPRPEEEWIPIQVPAIVTKELWEATQKALIKNRLLSLRNTRHDYLLRGIIKCGCCNRTMTGICRVQKGIEYKYYVCNKNMESWYLKTDKCTTMHIPASIIEESIWKALCSFLKDKLPITLYTPNEKKIETTTKQLEHLTSYYDELSKKRSAIMRWFRDNIIDSTIAEKELQKVQKEIVSTATALATISGKRIDSFIEASNLTADQIMDNASFQTKRDILLKLHYTIYVTKSKNHLDWYLGN